MSDKSNIIRFAPPPPPAIGERKELIIEAGALHTIALSIEQFLIEADAPIYRRATMLVGPHAEISEAGKSHVFVYELGLQTIREIVSRHIRLRKFDARKKELVDTDLPKDIAALLIERATHGTLRKLRAILNAQTLGPDWNVLDRPGYDLASGLVLAALPDMQPVPDHPTREEAEDGLVLLKDLLAEFPFANPESCSVGLSLLITPVCAGAVRFAPLHGITAAAPGTGKSYLAQMGSLIAHGTEIPVLAANDDPNELTKQLSAVLLMGERVVVLDNINGELDSSLLCQAVEQAEVKVRIFGKLEGRTVNGGGMWIATGNNLEIGGDLKRRSLLCELARDEERPELHVFSNDPRAMILAERGLYVRACLTIVRAYVAAGKPNLLSPIASYERWNLIRSALVWLGEADPCDTMRTIRALDGSLSDFEAVIVALYHLDTGFVGHTLREMVDVAAHTEGCRLREALQGIALGRDGNINLRQLGYRFRNMKGRIFSFLQDDGTPICVKLLAETGHTKIQRWMLRRAK